MSEHNSIAIQITRNGMGDADPELQHKLINSYLQMILNTDPLPAAITLYTEGVKLASQQSPVLQHLQALETRGVTIILCSTCVHFYNLQDEIAVGIIGGMHDIIEVQWRADKVITI